VHEYLRSYYYLFIVYALLSSSLLLSFVIYDLSNNKIVLFFRRLMFFVLNQRERWTLTSIMWYCYLTAYLLVLSRVVVQISLVL
jgi:hypothetical protein